MNTVGTLNRFRSAINPWQIRGRFGETAEPAVVWAGIQVRQIWEPDGWVTLTYKANPRRSGEAQRDED